MKNRIVTLVLLIVILFALPACAKKQAPAPAQTPAQPEITLDAPAELALKRDNGGVQVTWKAVEGSPRYSLQRRQYTNGAWSKFETIAKVSDANYTDTNVVSETKYNYRVCCLSADDSARLSDYCTAKSIVYVTYIDAPTLSDVKNADGGVQVTWNAVNGAVCYGVQRRQNIDGEWTKYETISKVSGTSYTDTSAVPREKYSYRVFCLSKDGNTRISTSSKGKSITYILPTPELISAVFVYEGVKVDWKPVPGAAMYAVFRLTNDGKWDKLGIVADTTFTDTTALYGYGDYTFTVCCVSADGETYLSSHDKDGITVPY